MKTLVLNNLQCGPDDMKGILTSAKRSGVDLIIFNCSDHPMVDIMVADKSTELLNMLKNHIKTTPTRLGEVVSYFGQCAVSKEFYVFYLSKPAFKQLVFPLIEKDSIST